MSKVELCLYVPFAFSFLNLSGRPWTQYQQCAFLRVLAQMVLSQLLEHQQLPASCGEALMVATGWDFGSVCSVDQGSATCCAQVHFSHIDRRKLPFTLQHTTCSRGAWYKIIHRWPDSVRSGRAQSSSLLLICWLAVGGEAESHGAESSGFPGSELGRSDCCLACCKTFLKAVWQHLVAPAASSCLGALLERILLKRNRWEGLSFQIPLAFPFFLLALSAVGEPIIPTLYLSLFAALSSWRCFCPPYPAGGVGGVCDCCEGERGGCGGTAGDRLHSPGRRHPLPHH